MSQFLPSTLEVIRKGQHLKPDKDGNTWFHKLCCDDGKLHSIENLLNYNHPKDVFICKNSVGETPLSNACKHEQLQTLNFMKNCSEKGYSFSVDSIYHSIKAMNSATNLAAYQILHILFEIIPVTEFLVKAANENDKEVIKFVFGGIAGKVDINNPSIIDDIVRVKDVSVVKFVVDVFESAELSKFCTEFLCRAAKIHQTPEIWVKGLASRIKSHNVNDVLCYVILENNIPKVAHYLVHEIKFDVDSKSISSGDCVLHSAVASKNLKVMKYLVEKTSCDLNIRNTKGQTPLQIACAKKSLAIIECLISSPRCDIADLQQHYPELAKKFEFLVKYHQALNGSGSLEIKVAKCILTGPPGSGKSTLLKKLLNLPLSEVSYSTDVCEAPVAVSSFRNIQQQKAVGDSFSWKGQDLDEEAIWIMENLSVNQPIEKSSIPSSTISALSDNDDSSSDDDDLVDDDINTVSIDAENEGRKLRKRQSIDAKSKAINKLQTFISKLPAKKRAEIISQNSFLAQSDLSLHFIDTGGQPEFHELLPALITGPAINLLVFKLTEELNSPYQVTYRSPDGDGIFEPYSMSLTHEEFIFRALTSIASLRQHTIGWKFSKAPIEDNSEPAALLIATHRDLVYESKVKKVNEQLRRKIHESPEFYHKDLVKFSSVDDCIFAINTRDNVEDVKSAVNEVIETNFRSHVIPASWLTFSLMLRKKNKPYVKRDTCFTYAKEVGVKDESEFRAVLWYLHHRVGTILHYPEVDGLRDIVITNLQPIFKHITKLITYSFTFKSLGKSSTENEFRSKGYFSHTDFSKIPRKGNDAFSPEKLVTLLKHLYIVAGSIKTDYDDCYFMPCALKPAAEAELKIDEQHISPLLVSFKCGYTPVGVFCCLIVYLLNQSELPWKLQDDIIHNRNKIRFIVGDTCNSITLISRATYLEVWVEQSGVDIYEVVLSVLDSGLKTVIQSLHYNHKSKHVFAILCNKCPSLLPHPAVIEHSYKKAKCLSSKSIIDVDSSQFLWSRKIVELNNKNRAEKVEIIDKNSDATSSLTYVLGIECLDKVLGLLESFSDSKRLGLELGLLHTTLKITERNAVDTQDFMINMLADWLKQKDKVKEKDGPTYQQLIDSLEAIGENALAGDIERKLKCKRKGSSETLPSAKSKKYNKTEIDESDSSVDAQENSDQKKRKINEKKRKINEIEDSSSSKRQRLIDQECRINVNMEDYSTASQQQLNNSQKQGVDFTKGNSTNFRITNDNRDDVVKHIEKVVSDNYSNLQFALTNLHPQSLQVLCNKLHNSGIICAVTDLKIASEAILRELISPFCLMMSIQRIEERCRKFLECLIEMGGPCSEIASFIENEWTKANII